MHRGLTTLHMVVGEDNPSEEGLDEAKSCNTHFGTSFNELLSKRRPAFHSFLFTMFDLVLLGLSNVLIIGQHLSAAQ